ncbi:molybdopterin-dependent oxidoreductase [Pseudonocardia sp. MCCB 268]|nr:molybdopterin-dependent oxidoreductase [Pseudonocardia cytotoxica]
MLGDAGGWPVSAGAADLHDLPDGARAIADVPVVGYDAAAVVTNTTPMGAFRGAAGRAAAHLERIMDIAPRS